MSTKAKIVSTCFILGVLIIVFGFNFLAAALNKIAPGYGVTFAVGLIFIALVVLGIVYLALNFARSANHMAKEAIAAVDQSHTKGEVTRQIDFGMSAWDAATRERHELNTTTSRILANQQDRLDQRERQLRLEQEAIERRLQQRDAMLVQMMGAMLGGMKTGGGQPNSEELIAQVLAQMNSSGAAQLNTQTGTDSIEQDENDEGDESDLRESLQPVMAQEPVNHLRTQIQSPMITRDMRVTEAVPDKNGKVNRWLRKDAQLIIAKYPPNVQLIARRIYDECYPFTKCTYESICDKLHYFSNRTVGEALNMLAELNICTRQGVQGVSRQWLDPETGRPYFEDAELQKYNFQK